jgi:hypothetical protein
VTNNGDAADIGTPLYMTNARNTLHTDISNTHPISIVYDATLASTNTTMYNPDVTVSGLPGTSGTFITGDMLDGNKKVQCTSCHDPHLKGNTADYSDYKFLRRSNAKSALCLTCHNK